MMMLWWVAPLATLLAAVLTGILRHYALARSLMDIPNERSSHFVATPRGGGVAIVLTFFAAAPLLGYLGLMPWESLWATFGAGALVAAIGFADDHGHIPARWRLATHFSSAAWVLFWLGGVPVQTLPGVSAQYGWMLSVAAVFGLVWLLNLYNFMDGIDGIASVEAITVSLGGALLYYLIDVPQAMSAPLILAATVLGFLLWNFPPARIFMGDAGSGFLGIVLGTLALQASWHDAKLLPAWLILLGVFIVDASWTLARRLLRGEKVYLAHRSHAYQYASRKAGSHLPVTLGVAALNFFWLIPIAAVVAMGRLSPLAGLSIAYAPLLVLAVVFHAGRLEAQR